MAEVFNLHRRQTPPPPPPPPRPRQHLPAPQFDSDEDDDRISNIYTFDLDSLSPPNHDIHTLDDPLSFVFAPDNSEYSESDSDPSDSMPDPFFLFGEEENANFVTDLLHSFPHRNVEEEEDNVIDPFGEFSDHNRREEMGSGLGLELGFRLGHEFSTIDGLRVVDSDSDTDTGSVEVDFGLENDFNEQNDYGVDDHDWPVIWDCMRFDNPRVLNEEFEWEEVNERDNLGSLIDRIEEISVSSGISSENGDLVDGEAGVEENRNLEWEVLLAVNNYDRNLEFDGDGADGNDAVTYLAVQDDYMYTVEYDTLFGQFVDSEGALKGSPPAAKSVVENLPLIVLKSDDVKEINVVCAVCKDDISVGEKVNKLPCSHYYHGDCIVPWLSIRNSCPVCRYELPTDDADYERSRGAGLGNDLQVRYNFETLP